MDSSDVFGIFAQQQGQRQQQHHQPPPPPPPQRSTSTVQSIPNTTTVHGPTTTAATTTRSAKSFRCESCGAQFSRQTILNEHIRAQHLQERVKCTICGQLFKRQNDRRRHETFQHLRKRAFQCKTGEFGCGKRFTRLDSLKEHQSSPRKAGTTCEKAMLHGRAATTPTGSTTAMSTTTSVASATLEEIQSMTATTMPDVSRMFSSSFLGSNRSVEPEPSLSSSISSTTPTMTADERDDFSSDFDAAYPSVADASEALSIAPGQQQHRSWQPDWQVDMSQQKKLPNYNLIQPNMSWASVDDSVIQHTTSEWTPSISASLPPAVSMPAPFECMVSQSDLLWAAPGTGRMDDGNHMWIPWEWQLNGDPSEIPSNNERQ